jgi:hypothetical protein
MELNEVSRKFADMVVHVAIALTYDMMEIIKPMKDSEVEIVIFPKGTRFDHNIVQIWNSPYCIIELSDYFDGEINAKMYLGDNILDMRNVNVETDDNHLMIYTAGPLDIKVDFNIID